jgi:hypothetical protein
MDTTRIFQDVLSVAQLEYISSRPEVAEARSRIEAGAKVAYFNLELPSDIKATLRETLGLDLSSVSAIPMRWIRGDTTPHVDVGGGSFDTTYLLYMNDSPGEFLVQEASYPLVKNTAFVFDEGQRHSTRNTGTQPRLLLGPMSEAGFAVGAGVVYYANFADAQNNVNNIASGNTYTVGNIDTGSIGTITNWRIAPASGGTSSQALVYPNGSLLNSGGTYYLYPATPCFLEGTKILCSVEGVETYLPVETLRKGTLVKTSLDGFKKVEIIAKGVVQNPGNDERIENRLYKCSPAKYPALSEDLYITGCHSILEYPLTEKQKEDTIRHLGRLFVTDKKHRLMACVDDRAEPWNSEGTYTIWHFALENADDGMNYGVYANGGLLVETCAIRTLKSRANMTLLE